MTARNSRFNKNKCIYSTVLQGVYPIEILRNIEHLGWQVEKMSNLRELNRYPHELERNEYDTALRKREEMLSLLEPWMNIQTFPPVIIESAPAGYDELFEEYLDLCEDIN